MYANSFPSAEFILRDGVVAGEPVILVTPEHIGCTWTSDNLYFRSSVWTRDGELVSPGFKKFFNHGEQPALYPPLPDDLAGVSCIEKIDGSCLIVSRFRGETVVRTRGTLDASRMELSGQDIEFLQQKYPKAFFNGFLSDSTLLYEWTSPSNKIVLDYGNEPDIYLIGCIRHNDYSMLRQTQLDEMAASMGVKRPQRYFFDDLSHLISTVKAFQDSEGICAYYDNDQTIVKVKGIRYLALHAFKSHCTLSSLLDVFLTLGVPTYQELSQHIESTFDYECRVMAESHIKTITDVGNVLRNGVDAMRSLVEEWRLQSKKEFALFVLREHKPLAPIAFHLWDRPQQEIPERILRNIMETLLDG